MYVYTYTHICTHIYVHIKCLLCNLLEVYLVNCYSDCLWGRGGNSEVRGSLPCLLYMYHIHILPFQLKINDF